jgi:hypothetical protein
VAADEETSRLVAIAAAMAADAATVGWLAGGVLEALETLVRSHSVPLTGPVLMTLSEALKDRARALPVEVPGEQGWQELLERGLQSKAVLLRSSEFKTTAQASALLGIGEPAVRKRIREGKLFALQTPVEGEHRIPAWALDPAVAGKATVALLSDSIGADEWLLYHALSTPSGVLNGLRPFECLLSDENLPASRRVLREELVGHLQLAPKASLVDVVRQALKAELADVAGQ